VTAPIPNWANPGIRNLTVETPARDYIEIVRGFFLAAGVDLAPPKSVFWNDRLGMLMVRATLQDLDTIEQAVQVLNMSPPQIMLEAKFAEVTQDDAKALGFDWFLGNTLINNAKMGFQGGSAPSFLGQPSTANPLGIFPTLGNAQTPRPTDTLLTTGLRNQVGEQLIPEVGTLTGILTDPQFRLVIRALEQRHGVDLLSAPKVTTLSGRQAQIKAVIVQTIATDLDLQQTTGGGGGGAFGGN
jgi:general secretion pathway protein D